MEKAIRVSSFETRLGKSSKLGLFVLLPRKRTILVEHPTLKIFMKDVDLEEPT